MLKQTRTMKTFEIPGAVAGGIRTVGQIRGTNTLIFHTGQNGMAVAVEAWSDLGNPVWLLLGIHTLANGSSPFTDSDGANHPARYYRFHLP